MSVYFASFNIGFIAGGPLGGLMARWFGLVSPLYIYAAACFISAVMFWRTIHDPGGTRTRCGAAGIRRLPWSRPLITVLVVNGVYLWMIGAIFQTLVPLFGTEELGLTLSGVGLGLAIATATELAVLYPAGHATDHRGRRAVLIPALIGLALSTAAFGLTSTTLTFMIAMGRARRGERLRGRPARSDALRRDACRDEGLGGRGLPLRGRPGLRHRPARRRLVGERVRLRRRVRGSARFRPSSRSGSCSRSARR